MARNGKGKQKDLQAADLHHRKKFHLQTAPLTPQAEALSSQPSTHSLCPTHIQVLVEVKGVMIRWRKVLLMHIEILLTLIKLKKKSNLEKLANYINK